VLRRGNQPGRLARQLIRKVGDADIALAGAETRPRVLKSLEEAEIEDVRAIARADSRALEELIAELRTDIDARAERRERRSEMIKDKVEQARLWRSVGAQERIPQMHMSMSARVVVLFLLASLDFYVFAQAYAVVADVGSFTVEWFLGGLLGLAVFIAGVSLAHAIKGAILSRAQREMLRAADEERIKVDRKVRERLVESRTSILALMLTAAVFLSLSVAGVLVRTQGTGLNGSSSAVVFFQALIPLVSVAVELYLHDPTERDDPQPNTRDRHLERRLVKAERRLRIKANQLETRIAKIERLYNVEAAILDVEQQDMGLRPTSEIIRLDPSLGELLAAAGGSQGPLPVTTGNGNGNGNGLAAHAVHGNGHGVANGSGNGTKVLAAAVPAAISPSNGTIAANGGASGPRTGPNAIGTLGNGVGGMTLGGTTLAGNGLAGNGLAGRTSPTTPVSGASTNPTPTQRLETAEPADGTTAPARTPNTDKTVELPRRRAGGK